MHYSEKQHVLSLAKRAFSRFENAFLAKKTQKSCSLKPKLPKL